MVSRAEVAGSVGVALAAWALAVYFTTPRQFAAAAAAGDEAAADRAVGDAVALRNGLAFALPIGLVVILAMLAGDGR